MFTIRTEDKAAFIAALQKIRNTYSEEWKCPTSYLEKAGYHTNLACQDVHSTTAAFRFATALLATGDETDLKTAEEILWNVAALQDKDPSSATYGIWSWYMEEPLDKMSPPDWNWADFCGKEICTVLQHHADRISHALYVYLEDTLRACALSIYRRNMHSGYTNISIMGSYVTLHASQLMNWEWLGTYAKNRFRRFVEYTRRNSDTFAEYNSATYTTVAISDLTRIYDNITDSEIHALAAEMLDDAWRVVSEHFHAPTRQWCGPNARSYTWLTAPSALSFIEQSIQHSVKLTDAYVGPEFMHDLENGIQPTNRFDYDVAWAYINLNCPEKYRGAFSACVPHDVNLGFTTGPDIRSPKDTVAISHFEEDYTLSSWQTVSTWNQRRNLLGFWGGSRPRFVNATILHNFYDFSSGMFTTAQKDGHAITVASIVNDGGDTHCNLDMIQNATIRAYDLRVRIEVGGCVEGNWAINGNTATFTDGGRTVKVKLVAGQYDGKPLNLIRTDPDADNAILNTKTDLHRRFVGNEKRRYLDIVFYSGEETEIKLSALKNAFCALFVSLDDADCSSEDIRCAGGNVDVSVECLGHKLETICPAACVSTAVWRGEAKIDGISYNETYHLDIREDVR